VDVRVVGRIIVDDGWFYSFAQRGQHHKPGPCCPVLLRSARNGDNVGAEQVEDLAVDSAMPMSRPQLGVYVTKQLPQPRDTTGAEVATVAS
jgi:hypothetical protein